VSQSASSVLRPQVRVPGLQQEEALPRRLFTSESVTEGHPDKIADQISDSVLDALLSQDPKSRVAVETLVTTGLVVVAGEVTTSAYAPIADIVRETVLAIGYDSSQKGFDGRSCGVQVCIGSQSQDIARGIDDAVEEREHGSTDPLDRQGAGDQGLMFGYACNETPQLMPLPIMIAHRLAERLSELRRDGTMAYLRPDGKTQVTIAYDGDRPASLETVVVSSQHAGDVDLEQMLTPDVKKHVVEDVLTAFDIDATNYRLFVNPTGRFEVGGPMGDAGVTGRKIIIDTYGGMARHGGGAFSGKDPSKVDRSAAYAMRWVAKNVVAAELARRCEVQIAYAIGKAHPVGFYVDCFGTEAAPLDRIRRAVLDVFDLRPAAIIEDLDLLRPIYARTATYGHFGRELPDFTWERTDRIGDLQAALSTSRR
jgi:S-adenosylmethionine synthetase